MQGVDPVCPKGEVSGWPKSNRPDAKGAAVHGNLENFNPGELIQIIGLLTKSGVLRLENVDGQGLVVFRAGKIIYAASPSVRGSLGSLLLARGIITEAKLTEALTKQSTDTEKTRLGTILVEMGALDQTVLVGVIKEQFSTVISEIVQWDAGTFDFEVKELVDRGEVELEAAEFLVASGVESTQVLLDAARRVDEKQHEEELPDDEPESLDALLNQVTSPTIGGEAVYRLLDLGSDTCGRCLLFAVHPKHFQVVGHIGHDKGLGALTKSLSNLVIPQENPSILARALDQRHPILARLTATGEDGKILESLGGPSPSKSLAIPLGVEKRMILVLYGDCLPEDLTTGRLDELEIAAVNLVGQLMVQNSHHQ